MATSSIGRTTVVDAEHGQALLDAVRKYRVRVAEKGCRTPPTSIADMRVPGERIRRR